ncbi:MAG: GIY-YIG nuclease family protein [Chloroflexota bacterium]
MPNSSQSGGGAPGYVGLRERAVTLLRQHRDGLDDAALAGLLFGAGDGSRWASLLAGILGAESRLAHHDGRWTLKTRQHDDAPHLAAPSRQPDPAHQPETSATAVLASASQPAPSGSPAWTTRPERIVALALATTGADPARHRVAGIGVVVRESGAVVTRLELVVGVQQRLARAVRQSARLDDEALDSAPTFADVVPTLREIVDGQTVHVYGAERARAFLEAELRRAQLPGLEIRYVEVDGLLRAVLPGTRKPGLAAAAAELGIPVAGPATPVAEADLTTHVLERLRERQSASPSRALAVDDGTEDSSEAVSPPRPLPFTRSWLRDVPEGPGVYLVLDAAGRVLYVGKALDLSRRLAAYVAKQPSQHRQFEALAVRAATVETIATRSDLEATLLEARLIRDHQPEFNTARQTREPTAVVRVAPDDRPPRVQLVSDVRADGARYFGPFESVRAARAALSAARAAYPDAFARRASDPEARRHAVLEVARLLSGQKAPTLAALRLAMQQAAARGEQPLLDRLRAALKGVQALIVYASPLVGLTPGWRLLVLERLPFGPTVTHLIEDGWLLRTVYWGMSSLPIEPARLRKLAAEILSAPPDDWEEQPDEDDELVTDRFARPPAPREDRDEPAIVLRWLTQARARIEVEVVPRHHDASAHTGHD